MYRIFLNDTVFYDPRLNELAVINPSVKLEENTAGSMEFTIPATHPRYDEIQRRKSVFKVYQDEIKDENLIFSGQVMEVEVDFYKQKYIYCEGELGYFNDSIQRPAKYTGKTVEGLLRSYISNHNSQVDESKRFQLGMVTVKDPNDYISCFTNMESTLECIKEDLVDDLGGFVRVRYDKGIRYLDYLADSVITSEQVIRLGENLLDFTSNIDSTDIASAIIPLGKTLETQTIEGLDTKLDIKSVNSGKDYVYNQNAVDTFGWIFKTVTWNDVTNPTNLKKKGEKYLSEIQFENVVINVKAVDMHLLDKNIKRIKLSDKIRVVSTPHGLNKYFRISKMTINLASPEANTFTLGTEEKISLSAKSQSLKGDIKKTANQASTEIRNLSDTTNGKIKDLADTLGDEIQDLYDKYEEITPMQEILEAAKENASALINGNGTNGHVVLHENEDGVVYEILIMDTNSLDTATRVWRWNENGLGYADHKDDNGNWVFGLAMTMRGEIVADFIKTGTLSADLIKSGTLLVGGNGFTSGINLLDNEALVSLSKKNMMNCEKTKTFIIQRIDNLDISYPYSYFEGYFDFDFPPEYFQDYIFNKYIEEKEIKYIKFYFTCEVYSEAVDLSDKWISAGLMAKTKTDSRLAVRNSFYPTSYDSKNHVAKYTCQYIYKISSTERYKPRYINGFYIKHMSTDSGGLSYLIRDGIAKVTNVSLQFGTSETDFNNGYIEPYVLNGGKYPDFCHSLGDVIGKWHSGTFEMPGFKNSGRLSEIESANISTATVDFAEINNANMNEISMDNTLLGQLLNNKKWAIISGNIFKSTESDNSNDFVLEDRLFSGILNNGTLHISRTPNVREVSSTGEIRQTSGFHFSVGGLGYSLDPFTVDGITYEPTWSFGDFIVLKTTGALESGLVITNAYTDENKENLPNERRYIEFDLNGINFKDRNREVVSISWHELIYGIKQLNS